MANSLEKAIVNKFENSQDSLVIQSSDLSLETIAQMVQHLPQQKLPGWPIVSAFVNNSYF